jgi:hypothetical protein
MLDQLKTRNFRPNWYHFSETRLGTESGWLTTSRRYLSTPTKYPNHSGCMHARRTSSQAASSATSGTP